MTSPSPMLHDVDQRARRGLWTRFGSFFPLILAVSAPFLAGLTYYAISRPVPSSDSRLWLYALLALDLCVALGLLTMIGWRIVRMTLDRRVQSAGSRLHVRLVRMFVVLAALPSLIMGIFAAVTVSMGLEAWLGPQVMDMARHANALANDELNQRENAVLMAVWRVANDLSLQAADGPLTRAAMREIMNKEGGKAVCGGFGGVKPRYYLINGAAEVVEQAEESYRFYYTPPPPDLIKAVDEKNLKMDFDYEEGFVRALLRLPPEISEERLYLYTSCPLNLDMEGLRARTAAMSASLLDLGAGRDRLQAIFGMIYVGFALLLVLAAIWFGVSFADRLARPVSRLAGAAERVAGGDLSARVPQEEGRDEIALLGRVFNRMTEEVERQRNALIGANEQIDRRRRFTEAVLAGVRAGVLGVDSDGRINLANASAEELLGAKVGALGGVRLGEAAPDFAPAAAAALASPTRYAEQRVALLREGVEMEFLVRAAAQGTEAGDMVITFDDMTDIASAQRLAAWREVARRVAHEIKNPLTPIQLSAERLKRRFGRQISEGNEVFDQCVDTIVRQVGDIRRMVDEFSRFARMPDPVMAPVDLVQALRDEIALQSAGYPDVSFQFETEREALELSCDRGMMAQVFGNLFKNAVEAIGARRESAPDGQPGLIRAGLRLEGESVAIDIADNGVGLPKAERRRLTEPYVTTRKKGTGLGLAIVKRIVEQHGGSLHLEDAPPFGAGDNPGALIRVVLPLKGRSASEPPIVSATPAVRAV